MLSGLPDSDSLVATFYMAKCHAIQLAHREPLLKGVVHFLQAAWKDSLWIPCFAQGQLANLVRLGSSKAKGS